MKRYFGGNNATEGVYLNLKTGEFVIPDTDSEILPGSSVDRYIKVPRGLPIIAGPIFGLGFVIFLPLAGIVGLCSFLAYKAGFASSNVGNKILSPILVGWHGSQTALPRRSAKEK